MLKLHHHISSPESRRNTATTLDRRQLPWLSAASSPAVFPLQGEHALESPLVSSPFSPLPWAPCAPKHRRPRWTVPPGGPPPSSCSVSNPRRKMVVLHITPWVPLNQLDPIVCLRSFADNPLDLLDLHKQIHPKPFSDLTLSLDIFASTIWCVLQIFSANPWDL
jgi:hypothetical protein